MADRPKALECEACVYADHPRGYNASEIRCRRYPAQQTKDQTSYCGEWTTGWPGTFPPADVPERVPAPEPESEAELKAEAKRRAQAKLKPKPEQKLEPIR